MNTKKIINSINKETSTTLRRTQSMTPTMKIAIKIMQAIKVVNHNSVMHTSKVCMGTQLLNRSEPLVLDKTKRSISSYINEILQYFPKKVPTPTEQY